MRASSDVDDYLAESRIWPEEIEAIRPILLDCGLAEEIKWGKPCYSHDGANIAILQEMKAFLAVMFFKGALLEDPQGMLHEQGPNSRSARRMQFTSVAEIVGAADTIKTCVQHAVDVEEAGLEVGPVAEPDYVEELQSRLDDDPAFRAAFGDLTPGRRREYNLHFAGAKQSKTRMSRIEKCTPKILDGKGLRDR